MNRNTQIEVATLKNMLGLADKYPMTAEFKRCVITPAIANIKKTTNITELELDQRRSGREVTHLIFKYSVKNEVKKPKTKPNGKSHLIPLFTGHPEYTVDSEAVLKDHERLKTKPEPKPKKTLDSGTKSKITSLKRAVTHG